MLSHCKEIKIIISEGIARGDVLFLKDLSSRSMGEGFETSKAGGRRNWDRETAVETVAITQARAGKDLKKARESGCRAHTR